MRQATARQVASSGFAQWRSHAARLRRREDVLRWSTSFLAVAAAGGGLVWMATHLPAPPAPTAIPAAIAVDLAPEPVAAQPMRPDLTVGPHHDVAQAASAPAPTPPPQELTAPPSPVPLPPVPVSKIEKRAEPRKPAKPAPQPKTHIPRRPGAEMAGLETPSPRTLNPATETTAPPSAESVSATHPAAPADGSPSSHASSTPARWQDALLARLERFKRYPAAAQADHEQGTAMLHFAMNRAGHILSASLESSSGYETLDRETLALVRRADPLPAPPDSVAGDPVVLTVPVEFSLGESRN
ncbi:energy transducer TonB [Acidomonas methanolica]|uniref:energy transducer TonB n=1 Tax=Acidomonas methanolica TaxID=437 RepID=UPI00211A2A5F|nr:energy transducer TonB [Acidomonas methanolica]